MAGVTYPLYRHEFTNRPRSRKISECIPGRYYLCVRSSSQTTANRVYMCVEYWDVQNGKKIGIVGNNYKVYVDGDCRFEEVRP